MKIGIKKEVEVEAKTLKLHLKVCDRFDAILEDQDGERIYEHDGYVPNFMPGDHYGDYVILDIDIESGKILNWEKPSRIDIENFINQEDEE